MKYLSNFKYFENISEEGVYVDTSTIPNSGKGLFAKKDFKKDDIICEFTGELIDEDEVNKRNKKSKHRGSYFIDMGDGLTMDSYNSKCLARYANDAEGLKKIKGLKNNSEIMISDDGSSVYIVATKLIKKDQEIFLKYGKSYWSNFKLTP